MSTPSTTIYICSGLLINSSYNHSIYFENATNQLNYFRGKVVKTLPAYSFVRRSWTLKVEADLTEAVKWNYLFFNYPTDNKTYYYFIDKVEYINDSTVEITLNLDVLQTYLFDFTLAKCFVEREHVDDDLFGMHTVDEGLDVGDYVYYKTQYVKTQMHEHAVLILSSFNPQLETATVNSPASGGSYGGIFSGLGLFAVPFNQLSYLMDKLEVLNTAGKIDGIFAMWIYPQKFIKLAGEQTWTGEPWCKIVDSFNEVTGSFTAYTESNLGKKYTKHKKLLTYPFQRLHVTNNVGAEVNFAIERFPDRTNIEYVLHGALTADAGTNLSFKGYLGNNPSGRDLSEISINSPAYPMCAWNSDTYKIWLAQNEYRLNSDRNMAVIGSGLGAIGSVASIVGGAAMLASGGGALAGAGMIGGGAIGLVNSVVGGVNTVKNSMGEENAARLKADQQRGSFNSSVAFMADDIEYTISQQVMTDERLQNISDYFTMYGYKVNRVKTPSIHNRTDFTYVKTIGCHAYGNITNDDLLKIQSIFDKGITWWVNGNSIGNYSLNNNTIGLG